MHLVPSASVYAVISQLARIACKVAFKMCETHSCSVLIPKGLAARKGKITMRSRNTLFKGNNSIASTSSWLCRGSCWFSVERTLDISDVWSMFFLVWLFISYRKFLGNSKHHFHLILQFWIICLEKCIIFKISVTNLELKKIHAQH